jgi:hypothetical protein
MLCIYGEAGGEEAEEGRGVWEAFGVAGAVFAASRRSASD